MVPNDILIQSSKSSFLGSFFGEKKKLGVTVRVPDFVWWQQLRWQRSKERVQWLPTFWHSPTNISASAWRPAVGTGTHPLEDRLLAGQARISSGHAPTPNKNRKIVKLVLHVLMPTIRGEKGAKAPNCEWTQGFCLKCYKKSDPDVIFCWRPQTFSTLTLMMSTTSPTWAWACWSLFEATSCWMFCGGH